MTLLLWVALLQEPAKPWTIDEAISLAKKALKENSEAKDWRPALKGQMDGFLERIGKDASDDSLRFVPESLASSFDDSNPILRKVPDRLEKSVLLATAAKGTKAKRTLLICESAEFEELHDSVIVCLGDVKAKKIRKTLVFAT